MPPKPKHINRFLAFCVFLICSQFSIGQNIELQTIASGGGLLKTSNASLSSTSGQTIIATTSANKNTLTQGFQQIDCDLNPEIFAIAPICENDAPVDLKASIQGGQFDGPGVSGSQLIPEDVGDSTYQIRYLIEINGCKDSAFTFIKVKPKPNVVIALKDTTCKSGLPIFLDQGTPVGGTYTGLGVFGTTFNPNLAGTGTKPIYYEFTDTNSCSSGDTGSVFVKNNPVVTLANLPVICPGTDTLVLTGGQPLGGNFSGAGVKNNIFHADSASFGFHLITYNYLDTTNGCTGYAQKSIINDSLPPNLSLNLPASICNNSSPFFLNAGNPFGGTYVGVSQAIDPNGFITPNNLTAGNYNVEYSYTSVFGCTNSVNDTLFVFSKPTVNLSSINIVCSNDTVTALNTGLPAGGNYSGPAISSNNLNPGIIKAGVYNYYYSFTDQNGCSASDTSTYTLVNPVQNVLSFPAIICENLVDINLNQYVQNNNPVFSGNGVTDSLFNPSVIGGGIASKIHISATDVNGCKDVDSVIVNIGTKPNVSLSINSVCENLNKIKLSGGTPAGGQYIGNTVDQFGFFYPNQASSITPITYSYSTSQGCVASDTFNLSLFNVTKPKIDTIPAVCSNDDTIHLSANVSGGFFSGNAVNGPAIFPKNLSLGQTNIYYERTDANGCLAKDTLITTVVSAPVISQVLNRKICKGESIEYSLPSNHNYLWSDGTIGYENSFSPGSTTINSVTVNNGICANTYQFNILVREEPQLVEKLTLPTCDMENGRLEVSASGSNGPFNYAWSSGHNNPVSLNLKAGVYELTITDDFNCKFPKTYALGNANAPILANSNIINPSCFNDSTGSITTTLSNPSNFKYSWLNGDNTLNRNNLYAGSYYLTIEDTTTKCLTVNEFVLDNPEPISYNPLFELASCSSTSGKIKLNASGGVGTLSYNWNTSETADSIINKASGVYLVTIQDANNCETKGTFFIPNQERLYVNLDTLALPNCNIADGKVSLKPLANNYSYSWSTGGQNSFKNNLSAGLLTTTITDGSCSFILPFNLTNATPIAPEICNVSIDTASNQAVVVWEGDGTNQTLFRRSVESNVFKPVNSSTSTSKVTFVDPEYTSSPIPFTYALQSENSCNDFSAIEGVNHSILLSTIQIQGGKIRAVWQDEKNDVNLYRLYAKEPSGSFNQVAIITPPTNFYDLDSLGNISEFLIAADINNCGADVKFSNISRTISSDPNIYVDNETLNQDVVVFPNPAQSFSYVNFLNAPIGDVILTVLGSKGEIVWRKSFSTNGTQKLFQIPVDQFSAGAYNVQITSKEFTQSVRLMVN